MLAGKETGNLKSAEKYKSGASSKVEDIMMTKNRVEGLTADTRILFILRSVPGDKTDTPMQLQDTPMQLQDLVVYAQEKV